MKYTSVKSKRTVRPRRKTYRNRKYKKPFNLVKYVNRMIETKKYIIGYTEQALTSASTYPGTYQDTGMNLAQSLTMAGRVGNWVNGVGFKTRFLLHNNNANCQFVRYLLLVNKEGVANTDHQTGANLFDNNSGTNTSLTSFTTNAYLVRRINKDKYHVLIDKIIRLGGNSDKDKIYSFTKYISLRGKKYNYDGTGAVAPSKNQIIEIWLTAEADDDAVGETVELTGESAFYYKDC